MASHVEAQQGGRGQDKGRCQSVSSAYHATEEQNWESYVRRGTLDGQNRLPEIIQGVEFRDGIKHEIKAA